MNDVKVGDIMAINVISMNRKDTVKQAAEVMMDNDIGSILINEEKGSKEGIVTEKDIITKVVAKGLGPEEVKLKDIMSSPLFVVRIDETIEDAAVMMRDKNVRRLPVVNNKNKTVGMITDSDIARYHPALMLLIEEGVRLDSPGINISLEERELLVEGVCEECETYTEKLRNVDGRWLCNECSGGGML
ncbi:MAG: inosine-5-monophosphate dehydrogenase [Candidatus Altiarchaeales archaeon HGW-Altiarchaeales-3]|nr:MAG: inosine-5-monophosphate dehydrogenase [Candidatus Altiarchaeales archaeon HGW-Altiarchaeales-3]